VEWDGNRQQVIITTGEEIGELDVYFFVYNSERADASDLNAIRRYVSNFHDTYNVLFDAAGYRTAVDLYDALRAEKDKIGKGDVAGIQIFGTASDVPAFPYVHKMKVMEPISLTTMGSNGRIENYVWTYTPSPDGGDPVYGPVPVDEQLMRERTNLLFFLWQYYANLEEGRNRLESFHNAKVEFAKLTESNQADLRPRSVSSSSLDFTISAWPTIEPGLQPFGFCRKVSFFHFAMDS